MPSSSFLITGGCRWRVPVCFQYHHLRKFVVRKAIRRRSYQQKPRQHGGFVIISWIGEQTQDPLKKLSEIFGGIRDFPVFLGEKSWLSKLLFVFFSHKKRTTFSYPKKENTWGKLEGCRGSPTEVPRCFFSVSFWQSEANPIFLKCVD